MQPAHARTRRAPRREGHAIRNPLIAKLEHGAALTDADRAVLTDLTRSARTIGARRDLIRESDRPDDVHLVLAGFACRYKILPDGKRRIVALLVPGDFCDLHVAILGAMDHAIATLTPCTIVDIPRAAILDLTENHPRITRALWWATLVDEAILREWLVSMGGREADQQLAHLFCELLVRLQSVGLADADGYDLPLTQSDLADVLGMTAVHVSRTVQTLREAGLVVFARRRLDIPDVGRLKAYCAFTPNYLHLTKRRDGDPRP